MYGSAVTTLSEDVKIGFKVSKAVVWVFLAVLVTGMLVGAFLMVAVKKAIILVAVAGLLVPAVAAVVWNIAWGKKGLIGFVRRYPDAELRGAIDGQYVKVTGVISFSLPRFQIIIIRFPLNVKLVSFLIKRNDLSID